ARSRLRRARTWSAWRESSARGCAALPPGVERRAPPERRGISRRQSRGARALEQGDRLRARHRGRHGRRPAAPRRDAARAPQPRRARPPRAGDGARAMSAPLRPKTRIVRHGDLELLVVDLSPLRPLPATLTRSEREVVTEM